MVAPCCPAVQWLPRIVRDKEPHMTFPIPRRAPAGPVRRPAGQGMTEYVIIVALVSVAAIGIYTLFGQTLRNQTAGLALEMSGTDATSAVAHAQSSAFTAYTNANVRKGLDNYHASNRP
jgi:Flp pilus assembly pilin Flp